MGALQKHSKKFALSQDDIGKPDSFRRRILTKVSSENYAGAIDLLKEYKSIRPEFPEFKSKSERYLDYGVDLVNGIKAKRSFPGMSNLPMNKQEELFSKAYDHFEDLKTTLKRVERIEVEVRLADKRASVWIIKALLHSIVAIVALGIIIEISHGAIGTAEIVVDDGLDKFTSLIFKFVGI